MESWVYASGIVTDAPRVYVSFLALFPLLSYLSNSTPNHFAYPPTPFVAVIFPHPNRTRFFLTPFDPGTCPMLSFERLLSVYLN